NKFRPCGGFLFSRIFILHRIQNKSWIIKYGAVCSIKISNIFHYWLLGAGICFDIIYSQTAITFN
ncbi:hypothetical protein, partial [Escherichia coli]|uniref:hypothetical protein n=1 Tax=Escherichia coli TaxID=562 RepID=UPI0030C74D93